MGWLLSEGTAVLAILLTALLVVSPRSRHRVLATGHALGAAARRCGLGPEPAPPVEHRPIEVVAHEARRLARRYRDTRRGVSYAKSEAVRRAYDDVLAEGCEALGVAHLLGVLDPGDELDTERVRVERVLHIWGLSVDDAA
jgi:hypothetical protein